ncbi:E3 ubiquitin-protein ligase TRAIP-like [Ochlerotatus camptorhynchus]|uniref:E3 ubiquitin-protein ligase TRAIP-like n=1 Tax=Ochlerotatus camptorhynchus TaxID=644619 RepID=UPI0031CFEA9B
MNFTCVICSDLFVPSDDIHITPCGHIFHYVCLVQWLERSKTCPQCRNRCIEQKLTKVYLTIAANVDSPDDHAALMQKLDNLTLSVREKDKTIKTLQEKEASWEAERTKIKKMLTRMGEKIKDRDLSISVYKVQLDTLKLNHTHLHKMEEELKQLKDKLRLMLALENVLNSTSKEVDEILALNDNPRALAVSVATLKRELQASEYKMNEKRDRIKSIQKDLSDERAKRSDVEDKLSYADSEKYRLEQEVKTLKRNAVIDLSTETGSDTSIPNTPDQQPKRKRSDTDLNESTPTAERVRDILESDSPYLRIKSCGAGLMPIFRPGLSASAALGKAGSTGLSKTISDPSEKYSIFRQSRPADSLRLGGANRTPLDPSIKLVTNRKFIKINRCSTSARLKSGQLSNHPSTRQKNGNTMNDYLAGFPTSEDFK